MGQSVTLNGITFSAARIQRLDGNLSYETNRLFTVGSEVSLVHARSGVASIVRSDGWLIPVPVKDLENNFAFLAEIPHKMARQATLRGMRKHVILGDEFIPRSGMRIRRTGLPFASLHEHCAPHDNILTLDDVERDSDLWVWYSTSDFEDGQFARRYTTTAYFDILS